jgi:hypothetical protein
LTLDNAPAALTYRKTASINSSLPIGSDLPALWGGGGLYQKYRNNFISTVKYRYEGYKDRNFTHVKLGDRITRLEAQIGEYPKELEDKDGKENNGGEKSAAEINSIVTGLS